MTRLLGMSRPSFTIARLVSAFVALGSLFGCAADAGDAPESTAHRSTALASGTTRSTASRPQPGSHSGKPAIPQRTSNNTMVAPQGNGAAAGEVVVQFHARASSATGSQVLATKMRGAFRSIRRASQLVPTAATSRPELVTAEVDPSSGKSVADVIADLRKLPEVQYAEPNYRYTTFRTPDDPSYGMQTHLGAIHAPAAWDVTTGSSSVVVAVIDTGIQLDHPDLQANIWHNSREIPGDGVDNDGNGFVDDVTGWDFVSATTNVAPDEDGAPPDNDPTDTQGHGTHVAGIIGAVGNNSNQGSGVAWSVALMPLRAGYRTPSGDGQLELGDIANALHYAADNGAQIASMSFGSDQPSLILADALRYAADHGVLLIAAAGNAGSAVPQYPAAYDRVLSVAATDDSGALASFSSFGSWVDLAAPGVNVLSTTIGGGMTYLSGTSMAAPVVAGTAALVRASHPTWSAEQIAAKLTSSAGTTASNAFKPFGAGFVDASAAVTPAQAVAAFDTAHAHFEEIVGDGDGQLEPGESGRMYVTVKNYGPTSDVTVSVQTSEPGVTVSGGPVTLRQIGFTRLATAAWALGLPASLPLDHAVTFNVTLTAGSRSMVRTVTLDAPGRWAPERVLAQVYPFAHGITELPNGSVAAVAELDRLTDTDSQGIHAAIKSASGQWSELTRVSGPSNAHQPDARVAPDGSLDVVYERNVGPWNNQIFYRHYSAATAAWGPEEQVTTNAVVFGSGQYVYSNYAVAADRAGRVHVAWVDSATVPRPLMYSVRTASGWSAPAVVYTFPGTDLAQAHLEMRTLPDDSRRLFVLEWSPSTNWTESVLSGTGTSWQAPQTVAALYDSFPTFVQGSDVFRIAKRTFWSDPVDLVKWGGSGWITDRTITPNLTDNWATMASRSAAAMSSNGSFGILVQDPVLEGPYTYYAGPAGALVPSRATARPELVTNSASLCVGSNGAAHALFGRYPATGFWITAGQLVYQSSVTDPGVVLPGKPSVAATVNTTALSASWSVSNPAQVGQYLVAAGTAPGLDDVSRWNATTATSVTIPFGERPAVAGETYYVSVKAISTAGYAGAVGVSPGVGLSSCVPETDAAFCARLAKNCGTVSGSDNCGTPRTVGSCGSCTSPQTCGGAGTPNVCGGGSTPCSGLCSSPIVFTSNNYQSGALGTAATCHQTSASLAGLNCGNFASGRTFRVNGVQITCVNQNVTLPPKRNGGYCLQASAGNYAWAYFATW